MRFTMVNFVYLFYTIVKGFYLSKQLSVTSTILSLFSCNRVMYLYKNETHVANYDTFIGKIFVYKHCFCYLNAQNVKQKKSLFHEPIVLWLAY